MNQSERDMIGKMLVDAAIVYDRSDFDKAKISMTISVIERFFPESSAVQICEAIQKYMRNPKNTQFPAPARLNEYLRPQTSKDARAQEIASRIRESISKFGYTNPEEAKAYIGEIGWTVVKRFGGWQSLCEDAGVSLNVDTLYAQSRELAKSQIELDEQGKIGNQEMLDYKTKSPDVFQSMGLQSPKDVLSLITSKSEKKNEDVGRS